MSNSNNQEQTIYRMLAGEIQAGFFDNGARFPSVQQIAGQYGVSCCPAQRALKALERDGLICLCRGKETKVLAKPYADYLQSEEFCRRAQAIADLYESLCILAPAIFYQGMGMAELHHSPLDGQSAANMIGDNPISRLHRLFVEPLNAMQNRLARNFFYDSAAFMQSALTDILARLYGEQQAGLLLNRAGDAFQRSMSDYSKGRYAASRRLLTEQMNEMLLHLRPYFQQEGVRSAEGEPASFTWEPYKGRAKHCDAIAIDLLCKIHRGVYPAGEYLPNNEALAEVYHVSPITIRRTMNLLSKLGAVRPRNGIGTEVVQSADTSVACKLKDLMFNDNMCTFLEALHLIAATGEQVLRYTVPHMSDSGLRSLIQAASEPSEKKALDSTVGVLMQAIVRCCPFAAVREMYSRLTLLLLQGSILRLNETGSEHVPGWPALAVRFQDSAEKQNGEGLAKAFGQLAAMCFTMTKISLQQIGVTGVEALAIPAARED